MGRVAAPQRPSSQTSRFSRDAVQFLVGMACRLRGCTAAAKLTPDGTERSTALGRLTSAYTVGGVVGPGLIQRKLEKHDDDAVAIGVAVVAAQLVEIAQVRVKVSADTTSAAHGVAKPP